MQSSIETKDTAVALSHQHLLQSEVLCQVFLFLLLLSTAQRDFQCQKILINTVLKTPVDLQPFRLQFKHQHPLGYPSAAGSWEGALSRSGCLKALPKRKKRGQKGIGAGEDIGLALFSFTAALTSSV